MVETTNLRPSTAFLNIIFTDFDIAPRKGDNALIVEGGNQVVPIRHGDNARIIHSLCLLKHAIVNSVKEVRDALCDVSQRDWFLIPSISADRKTLLFGKIVGTDFETEWNTLKTRVIREMLNKNKNLVISHFLFPIIELISRGIALS